MNRNTLTRPALFLSALSLFAAAWLFAPPARADLVGATCTTERGSYVDVMTSIYEDACLGHVERVEGRWTRTVALPEPMSGDVRGSRDLKSVIYVANYLSLTAKEAVARNPVVVRVYRLGELVKEHRLLDIATAADLRESISHVRFARDVGSIDANTQIALVTNTGARVVIDGVSGERLPAK